MTIHFLFSEHEQEIIHEALMAQLKKCKKLANAPIKGYGNAKEYDKKEQWANKATEIEELLSKIVEMSF